jgi:hypothetical protein
VRTWSSCLPSTISDWVLRIYLLILLGLIGLKFVRVFAGHDRNPAAPADANSATEGKP